MEGAPFRAQVLPVFGAAGISGTFLVPRCLHPYRVPEHVHGEPHVTAAAVRRAGGGGDTGGGGAPGGRAQVSCTRTCPARTPFSKSPLCRLPGAPRKLKSGGFAALSHLSGGLGALWSHLHQSRYRSRMFLQLVTHVGGRGGRRGAAPALPSDSSRAQPSAPGLCTSGATPCGTAPARGTGSRRSRARP